MANALVQQLRKALPDKTAGRSDEELTDYLARTFEARGDLDAYRASNPDFEADLLNLRNSGGDIGRETMAAAKVGVLDRIPGALQSAAALGFDSMAEQPMLQYLGAGKPLAAAGESLRGMARANREEAAARIEEAGGRTIKRVEDIRPTSPRDYMLWALPMAAENLPPMAASLAAGAAASVATGGAALPGLLTAGAVSIGQGVGETYDSINSEPGKVDRRKAIQAALVGGTISGVLDVLPEVAPLTKLFPGAGKSAIGKIVEGVLGRGGWSGAGRGAFVQSIGEGTTEAMQEAIGIAAEEYATGKKLSPVEVQSRLFNAAASGAVIGGPVGALTGAIPSPEDPQPPVLPPPPAQPPLLRIPTPAVPAPPPPAPAAATIPTPPPAAPAVAPVPPAVPTPVPVPPAPVAAPVVPPPAAVPPPAPALVIPSPESLGIPGAVPAAAADLALAPAPVLAPVPAPAPTIQPEPEPDAAAEKRAYLDEQLAAREITKEEHAQLVAEIPAPVPAPTAPAVGLVESMKEAFNALPPTIQDLFRPENAGAGPTAPMSPPTPAKPAAKPDPEPEPKKDLAALFAALPPEAKAVAAPAAAPAAGPKPLLVSDHEPAEGSLSHSTSNDDQDGGRYGVAMVKDGRVEIFNVYRRKDGTRMLENSASLLPQHKFKGTGRAEKWFLESGWTVKVPQFRFAQPSPNFRASMSEAEFDAAWGESKKRSNDIIESISDGRGDRIVELGLQASDPAAWAAVQFLRDKIAVETGLAPSHILRGLGTRVDSVAARDTLRANATAKKLAAGDLLRTQGDRVFGVFSPAEWTKFKALVAAGQGDAAIAAKFDGKEFKSWGTAMGELGAADQVGDAAFKGSKVEATTSIEGTAGMSEKLAATETESDVEPESETGAGAAREALLASGFDDTAITAAVTELLDFEDLTANDVTEVVFYMPEAEGFMKLIQRSGPQKGRLLLEAAVQNLLTLHDEATNRNAGDPSGSDGNLGAAKGDAGRVSGAGSGGVQTPGGPASKTLRSEPLVDARYRASEDRVARAWSAVVSTLRDAGIDVSAVQAAVGEVDAFYRQTGGRTDARRFIELVLKDVAAPSGTDLEVAVHEAVHVLFAAQPPETRAAIHRAIAALPEPDSATNRSLQNPDPEIRLQERLAVLLQTEGLSAGAATGIGARVARLLKDIYLGVARAIATIFGHRSADAFALRHFRNRLDSLLNGDLAPKSLVNALGGRPLSFVERAVMLPGFGRSLGRVLNGRMVWAPKVPDSAEALAFNLDLAFSRPEPSDSEANVRRGIDAVNAVLNDHGTPVRGAMYRPEVGSVTFEWGNPGDPAKAFHGGFGIGHILARRAVVGGESPVEVIARLVETIAYGDASAPYGGEGDTRVRIDDGTNSVILSLARHGKRETWVITSFAKNNASVTGASAKEVPSTKAAQGGNAFSLADLVAVTDGLKLGARMRVVKDDLPAVRLRVGDSGSEKIAAVVGSGISTRDINPDRLLQDGLITERQRPLLAELQEVARRFGLRFQIQLAADDELPPRAAGAFSVKSGNILISARAVDSSFGRILLHEFAHALTHAGLVYVDERMDLAAGVAIQAKPRNGVSRQDLRAAAIRLDELLQVATQEARARGLKFTNALNNRSEFVAEAFSSKKFQEFLASIPSSNAGRSLFSDFIGIVKRLLGVDPSVQNSLDEVIALADTFVGAQAERSALPFFYSQPTPIGSVDNPASAVNRDIATINHQIYTDQVVDRALSSKPGLLAISRALGRPAVEWLRLKFRLDSPTELKAQALSRLDPTTQQPVAGVNAATMLHDIKDTGLATLARIHAYDATQRVVRTLSGALTAAMGELPAAQRRLQKSRESLLEEHQNYLDQERLTPLVQSGLRRLIARERRLGLRAGQQSGVIMQQLREIDRRSESLLDAEYAPVFAKLFTGDQLRGRNLFSLLDSLVSEVKFHPDDSIADVRRRIGERVAAGVGSSELGLLIQGTAESKALLATVIAYGKANARVLAQLERRRVKNINERVALQESLTKMLAERDITNVAVRDLAKTAKLEERMRVLYVQARRATRAQEAEVAEIESRISAADTALPIYRAALAELQKELGVTPDYRFGDGMTYPVPNAAGEMTIRTLGLDSTREVTDRDALRADIERMTQWLGTMEAARDFTPQYFDVRAARDALLRHDYESELRKSDAWVIGNLSLPVGEVTAAVGTPTGRIIREKIIRAASIERSLQEQGKRLGNKVERTRDVLVRVLNRGRKDDKMNLARFELTIAQPALAILDGGTSDLRDAGLTTEQQITRGIQRAINHLSANPETSSFIRGNEADVAAALRAHVLAREEASKFISDTNAKLGVKVLDERLIVARADGTETEGIRDALPGSGVVTVSRTTSELAGRTYRGLQSAGWSSFQDAITEMVAAYSAGGPAAVKQWLAADPARAWFSNPRLMQDFVGAMAENPVHGIFDAPVQNDGVTKAEANPAFAAEAWRASGGDVVAFVELLYDLHGGTSDRAAYFEATMTRLQEYWHRLGERLEAGSSGLVPDGLQRLTADIMIDARTAERWPAAWTRHLEFDAADMHRLGRRVATQAAYGREASELDGLWRTLEREVDEASDRLNSVEESLERQGLTGRALDRAVEKEIGAAEFARLSKMRRLARRLGKEKEQLRSFYHRSASTLDGNNFLSAVGSFISSGMLNNVGSAMMNLADTFAPIVQTGVSRSALRQVASTWRELGEGFAGSVAQAFGIELGVSSDEARAFKAEGYNDAADTLQYIGRTEDGFRSDLLSGVESSDANPVTKALQLFTRTMAFGVTPRGESKAGFTALRPLAPFANFVLETHRASTIATWRRVGNMVLKGIEYFEANPAAERDPTFRITGSAVGLKGTEAESFDLLAGRLSEGYGLDLSTMVREAMARRSGGQRDRMSLLSPMQRALIQGMVSNELILDANVATMSTRAWNSSLLRVMLPLLGWPIRRAMQVARTGLDSQDKFRMELLGRGMLALGVLAAGGLAMSLLADEYHEEIVGKKRNLRSVKSLPGALGRGDLGEAFFTVMENVNRAGTFGMWGEILNTGINVAAGEGDNRALSLDQRVVLFSSLQSLRRSLTTAIAQGEVDYSGVVRPAFMALGGNSALQFLQVANNLTGMDNAEARFVERVHAQNWLRVGGREGGLEVRKGGAALASPTALTPVVNRMVLAAYAGNRSEFIAEWRDAVRQAREMGKTDPVGYVRDSFAGRHPLKNVFRTLSQDDYSKLLRSMDPDGRRVVRAAVDHFNAFAVSLDARPYYGAARR